jgi:ElaA protein
MLALRSSEVVTSMRVRLGSELSVEELYSLLCLRVGIFIVEQHIAYPDLDGRDLLSTTHHFWLADGAEFVSCLRVSLDGDNYKVARVCTKYEHRRKGLASVLMSAAMTAFGRENLVLEAQSYLVDFYHRFDFVVNGPMFHDDGVPHLPMRRDSDR